MFEGSLGIFDPDGTIRPNDAAGVPDLATRLCIERRVVQENQDFIAGLNLLDVCVQLCLAVYMPHSLYSSTDRRLVVSDEVRFRQVPELRPARLDTRARLFSLESHGRFEAFLIDLDAALLCKLSREVNGKPVCVMQFESVSS